MRRPLFRKSIGELEALLEEAAHDAEALRTLIDELSHHNRPRALRLKDRATRALGQLSALPRQQQDYPAGRPRSPAEDGHSAVTGTEATPNAAKPKERPHNTDLDERGKDQPSGE